MTEIIMADIQLGVASLLRAIGEDPKREGLRKTPERVARFWEEFINYDPGNIDVTFESVRVNQMVAVTGIRVYSLCEHHLLPFYCDLSIGYITTNKVIGLSKMARIAHKHAHKLQLQERLVDEIASELVSLVSEDVGVIGKGFHMCMAMRGIKTPATMTTSAMRGRFLDPQMPQVRAEFMQLIK